MISRISASLLFVCPSAVAHYEESTKLRNDARQAANGFHLTSQRLMQSEPARYMHERDYQPMVHDYHALSYGPAYKRPRYMESPPDHFAALHMEEAVMFLAWLAFELAGLFPTTIFFKNLCH